MDQVEQLWARERETERRAVWSRAAWKAGQQMARGQGEPTHLPEDELVQITASVAWLRRHPKNSSLSTAITYLETGLLWLAKEIKESAE